MPRCRWTDSELLEMDERIDSGYATVRSLARERGASAPALYKLLERRGLGRRKNWRTHWVGTLHLPEDPIVLAYIAGIFDGEGSILWAGNTRPGTRERQGAWRVQIGMTEEPLIRWLHSFGGTLSHHGPSPPRQEVWRWTVARHVDVIVLLRAILPYVKVQYKVARIGRALSGEGPVKHQD